MVSFIENTNNKEPNNFYIHTNVSITKGMTSIQYYLAINKHINNFYEQDYFVKNNYDLLKIEFYGITHSKSIIVRPVKNSINASPFHNSRRSYSTVSFDLEKRKLAELKRKHITPLMNSGWNNRIVLCSLDVETCKISDDVQFPCAVSFAYSHYSI